MSKRVLLSVFCCWIMALVFAGNKTGKDAMDIKITVRSLENTKLILANYYGDKQYVKDTFLFDKKGTVEFKADTMLPGGVYLAVFPALGNRYFEFIINEHQ